MSKARITVMLTNEELTILEEIAKKECRHIRDQARYLIVTELERLQQLGAETNFQAKKSEVES